MKYKEKLIEEMARVLDECCNFYDENGTHLGNKCNSHDCEYWCDTNNLCCSYNKKEATALYEQGYRKTPEDFITVSEFEYKDLKYRLNRAMQYNSLLQKEIDEVKEELRTCVEIKNQSRKETAREICFKIIKDLPQPLQEKWKEFFAKEYGVEVKE